MPVPIPEIEHGQLYEGDCYIALDNHEDNGATLIVVGKGGRIGFCLFALARYDYRQHTPTSLLFLRINVMTVSFYFASML